MSATEAINRAREFLKGMKHAPVHWNNVRAVRHTGEDTPSALKKVSFGKRDAELKSFISGRAQRSHWEVDFPLVMANGHVQSPDTICVRVYEDTAECEIVWQL